mgnify:CR=1 FL=1
MANTYVLYTSAGSQTDFVYAIPTITTTDIKVSVDGTIQTTGYSLIGATTDAGGIVRFDTAVADGLTVLVYRDTPTDSLPVDFTDGSILTEADLDKNFNHIHFATQEKDEQNALDLDYKYQSYDAAGKKIVNVGEGSLGTDAVNVDMLNRTAMSGGTFAVPQVWTFLTASEGQTAFILDASTGSGLPQGTEDNFYIVSVGGVVQDPDDDFNVTESGGVFTCTLTTGLDAANIPVFIRNFGLSRSYLEQPIVAVDSASDALTLKAPTSEYTGKYIQIDQFDGDSVFTIEDGGSEDDVTVKVGGSQQAANTSISSTTVEVSDTNNSSVTSRGVLLKTWDGVNYALIQVQGNEETGGATDASRVYWGNKKIFTIKYGGVVHCTGIEAHAQPTAGNDVEDAAITGTIKGGDTISGGLTVGSGSNQFVVDSNGTVDNTTSFTSQTYISYATGEAALIPHSAVRTYRKGGVKFSSQGIQLHNYDEDGWSDHFMGVSDVGPFVAGASLYMNSQKIEQLATPTAATDAATKAYVDSQAGVLGRWNFIASTNLVGDTAAFQSVVTGLAAYERIRFEFRAVQPEDAAAGPSDPARLFIQFRNASAVICELHGTSGTAVGTQGADNDHGILSISSGSGGMVIDNFLEGYNLTGSMEMYGHDSGDQRGVIHSEFHHHSFDHTSQDIVAGYLTQEVNTDVIDEMRMIVARGGGAGSPTDYRGFDAGQVRVYGMNFPTS